MMRKKRVVGGKGGGEVDKQTDIPTVLIKTKPPQALNVYIPTSLK